MQKNLQIVFPHSQATFVIERSEEQRVKNNAGRAFG